MIPILYISHYRSIIGGSERQLFYLVTHLDKTKFQPIVVCSNDGHYVNQLRKADIHTVVLKLPLWRKAVSYPTRYIAVARLIYQAKKHKIRLIHAADPWLNPYVKRVKKQLNVPTISHVPNLLTPKQVKKYDFEFLHRIIAISEQSKLPIVRAGISPEKISVITNCVDLTLFQPDPMKRKTESDLFIVGTVGRIEPFKRQKTFVEIAKRVNQYCKNVRFHIIGASQNTTKHRSYENEVRQMVLDYKLDNIIYFLGHRNDMQRAMCELDILVTLSAGSVIAEGMACAKPVIGTSIGSTADMIVDGETGYILPEDTIDDITEKIIHLIENPDICSQMGNTARKHAEEHLGIENYVQKNQAIYETLLD